MKGYISPILQQLNILPMRMHALSMLILNLHLRRLMDIHDMKGSLWNGSIGPGHAMLWRSILRGYIKHILLEE
jgi:hypothetical protein